jgi:hypothetical protein
VVLNLLNKRRNNKNNMNFRKIKILGIKIFSASGRNKWYQYWLKKKNENSSIFLDRTKLMEYRYYSGR